MQKLKSFSFIIILLIGTSSLLYLNACKKDACAKVSCKNGGVCADGTCNCTTGYEGSDCSALIRDGFAGTYNGTSFYYISSSSQNSVVAKLTISAGTGLNQIAISGVGVFQYGGSNYIVSYATPKTLLAYINLSTNEIQIPSQIVGQNIYSGSGALLSGNELSIRYIAQDISTMNAGTITFTGTK